MKTWIFGCDGAIRICNMNMLGLNPMQKWIFLGYALVFFKFYTF